MESLVKLDQEVKMVFQEALVVKGKMVSQENVEHKVLQVVQE